MFPAEDPPVTAVLVSIVFGFAAQKLLAGPIGGTMALRVLVSSSDATGNWALRCFVRERLFAFLGKLDNGSHLPHDRTVPMSLLSPGLQGSPVPAISRIA